MTLEIIFLLAVLLVMVYCFMTEVLPVELTAFVGLLVLIFAGMVKTDEAFQGFSSPAVMTMFSIFFISAALLETGVADAVAARIHALVGSRETPLVVLIMLVAGVLSAFMNNVAAAAVMLPAIAALAKQAGLPPGRLFMPLSFGAILGGTTTLVGTPPNILAAEVLNNRGLDSFSLFDFTPIGLALLTVGILFMTTVGRRLLPSHAVEKGAQEASRLTSAYRIEDRLTTIRIPAGSGLDGKNLREARLGTTLDVRVLAVERKGQKIMAPEPDFQLHGGDLLLVDGNFRDLQQLLGVQGISVQETDPEHLQQATEKIRGARLRLRRGSGLVGKTLAELQFRRRFGVLVVGVRREEELLRQQLAQVALEQEDHLMVLGTHEQLEAIAKQKTFELLGTEMSASEILHERVFPLRVDQSSNLVGLSVGKSRIGELSGLVIVGILRGDQTLLAVDIEEEIRAGDELLIAGEPARVLDLLELGNLQLESEAAREDLESSQVAVTEAIVAPRSQLAGKTPREILFRDRFGLQVLALWREGKSIHRDLANQTLRFGDALLLHGPREKIRLLDEDSGFVVLNQESAPPRRTDKAPVALGSLALMIALVATGLYPIHIAAFAGAVSTVLFGSLKMEQAYRAIEWRALFLVAAVLPVGNAMESSGAANFLADMVVRLAEPYGTYAFLTALVVLSSLLSQGLDGAPTVVILAPVVILTAEQLQVSPQPLMMAVGMAASAAFMTPFSHKANLLVMSAGGYRAMDFVRVGTPLTIIVLILIIVLVPIFFPFDVDTPKAQPETPNPEETQEEESARFVEPNFRSNFEEMLDSTKLTHLESAPS